MEEGREARGRWRKLEGQVSVLSDEAKKLYLFYCWLISAWQILAVITSPIA